MTRCSAPIRWLEGARRGVRSHHERFDGQGYPDGLAGEEIPLVARIIAVADTFDAVTSRRSYRGERSVDAAIAVLEEAAGSQLDPAVVAAFTRHLATIQSALLALAIPPAGLRAPATAGAGAAADQRTAAALIAREPSRHRRGAGRLAPGRVALEPRPWNAKGPGSSEPGPLLHAATAPATRLPDAVTS